MEMLLRAFGEQRHPSTLSRREWDSFIDRRRRGDIAPAGATIGHPVRDRPIEQDCNLLLAILNWATQTRDSSGAFLLERNPLKGLPVPKEASPARPILTAEQFVKIRAAAQVRAAWLDCFATVCWYAGHRCQSVRLLRWSDVDFEGAREFIGGATTTRSHTITGTPLDGAAVASLRLHRARCGVVDGEAWVFSSERDPRLPRSEHALSNLWKRLAEKAGIPMDRRYGWHSCRRAFANELRDVPLRDLKDLGGWKSERTVVSVYQQPSGTRRGVP